MTDYSAFLNMTAEEIKQDWLNYMLDRDPLLRDTSDGTFNAMLAEGVAAQFWTFIQLLKQKVADGGIMTASGNALSALVLDRLPEGRYPGTKATGSVKFSRSSAAQAAYVVPLGTVVAMQTEAGSQVKFVTTEEVTLAIGQSNVYATSQAVLIGTSGNIAANTISHIVTPVIGISSVSNDMDFSGGTAYESDEDLKLRYIYTIWITGKATIPMIEEKIDALEGIREVQVLTVGMGDVLAIVDSEGGIATPEEVIGECLAENLAAGCTSPGLLGASLRSTGHLFELEDCSGGKVWVRTLQYLSNPVTIGFTYTKQNLSSGAGTITIPGGSPAGFTMLATLADPDDFAMDITASDYAGTLSFDLFMALGTYPYCWIAPELQDVDVVVELVLTATPEADLLDKIEASINSKLASYKIGDPLQHADIYKHVFIDHATNRVFSGIDDVPVLDVTCKGDTISLTSVPKSIAIDDDERIEPGDISVTEYV